MPGLIRGVARTAVVAGTATAVSNRVSRRQVNRWAEDAPPPQAYAAPAPQAYAAPPPLPAAPAEDDMLEQLTKLGQLRDAGVLTDEEFAQQKARVLKG
ncbi:MAG: SHOCT domain-containing protein [Jiangellales bacterium]